MKRRRRRRRHEERSRDGVLSMTSDAHRIKLEYKTVRLYNDIDRKRIQEREWEVDGMGGMSGPVADGRPPIRAQCGIDSSRLPDIISKTDSIICSMAIKTTLSAARCRCKRSAVTLSYFLYGSG
jgi:hypothetical protein